MSQTPRTAFAAGRVKGPERQVAYRCSWCGAWYSPEDEQAAGEGARVSDGICDDCEERHFGELMR